MLFIYYVVATTPRRPNVTESTLRESPSLRAGLWQTVRLKLQRIIGYGGTAQYIQCSEKSTERSTQYVMCLRTVRVSNQCNTVEPTVLLTN